MPCQRLAVYSREPLCQAALLLRFCLVGIADQNAGFSEAVSRFPVMYQGLIPAAAVFLFDGLLFGLEIAPGPVHHVHGMRQFMVQVLNGGIFDILLPAVKDPSD